MSIIAISDREWSLFAGAPADCFKRYLALKMRRAVQTGVGDVSRDDNCLFIDAAPSFVHEKESPDAQRSAL